MAQITTASDHAVLRTLALQARLTKPTPMPIHYPPPFSRQYAGHLQVPKTITVTVNNLCYPIQRPRQPGRFIHVKCLLLGIKNWLKQAQHDWEQSLNDREFALYCINSALYCEFPHYYFIHLPRENPPDRHPE